MVLERMEGDGEYIQSRLVLELLSADMSGLNITTDMNEFLDNVNTLAWQYSALINVFLTLLLVLITGFYAYLTRAMWREMQIARKANILPIIICKINDFRFQERVLKGCLFEEAKFIIDLKIVNVGCGPAYDVNVSVLSGRNSEDGNRQWSHQLNRFHILEIEPGQEKTVNFESYTENDPESYNHPDVISFLLQYKISDGEEVSVYKWYSQYVSNGFRSLNQVPSEMYSMRRRGGGYWRFNRFLKWIFRGKRGGTKQIMRADYY